MQPRHVFLCRAARYVLAANQSRLAYWRAWPFVGVPIASLFPRFLCLLFTACLKVSASLYSEVGEVDPRVNNRQVVLRLVAKTKSSQYLMFASVVVLINAVVSLDVVRERRNRKPQSDGEAVDQDESTDWRSVSRMKPVLVEVGEVEDKLVLVVRSGGNGAMV